MKKKLLLILSLLACNILIKAQSPWVQQIPPFADTADFFDIEAPSANVVWANPNYGFNNTVQTREYWRSLDGGANWTSGVMTGTPVNFRVSNIWPIDSTVCYACMYNSTTNAGGNVFKTVDGGLNWVNTNAYNASSSFADFVYFYDPAHGVTVGDPQGGYFEIYTTSDSGNTWTRVPSANIPLPFDPANEFAISNLFNASQGHIWFVTTHGFVYHSRNMGLTWTKAATGFPHNIDVATSNQLDIDDVAFVDSLHGLVIQVPFDTTVAGRGPFLRSTSDGGATWSSVSYSGLLLVSDLDAVPGTSVFISSGQSSADLYGHGTTISTDNGQSWRVLDTTIIQSAIDFFDATHGYTGQLTLANFGGFWQYDPAAGPVAVRPIAETISSSSVYPNPSTGIVNYSFKTESPSRVKISVLNLMGEEVFEKDFGSVSGVFNQTLDLGNLSKGVYVVRLLNGDKFSSQKIVIQ